MGIGQQYVWATRSQAACDGIDSEARVCFSSVQDGILCSGKPIIIYPLHPVSERFP